MRGKRKDFSGLDLSSCMILHSRMWPFILVSVKRVPLQRPSATHMLRNRIYTAPILRWRQCGGMPGGTKVCRYSSGIVRGWFALSTML